MLNWLHWLLILNLCCSNVVHHNKTLINQNTKDWNEETYANINETCSVSEEQPIWAAQRNTTPTIKPGAQPRCVKINHCSSICKDNQWIIFHPPIWNFENNAQVDKNGDHVENAGVFIKIQIWDKYSALGANISKNQSQVFYVKGQQGHSRL